MSEIFRACAAVHPVATLKPGDFYINNDPYGGGQHLQDVFIFQPIFVDGEHRRFRRHRRRTISISAAAIPA